MNLSLPLSPSILYILYISMHLLVYIKFHSTLLLDNVTFGDAVPS